MKLRSILDELFLEFAFSNSRDEDRPGNKQIVVFQDDESYNIEGNTHGGLSHAIKHLNEFNPSSVTSALNNAMSYIKKLDNIFIKHAKTGEVLFSGEDAKKQLNLNAILNTFDLINDKIKTSKQLTPEEKEIKSKFLDSLLDEYKALVQTYIDSSVNVDDKSEAEIQNILNSNKKIAFKGEFKGNTFDYVLDPSNTGLLAKKGDSVYTLFRIDKKGSGVSKAAGYFSRGVNIINPELKKVLNIE